MAQKRIAYKTIGCKLNFAETSTIVRDFEHNGFEVVDFSDIADVYLINTCTVTANADKDCRKSVRQALRNNPEAYVAMVGCYSQLHNEEAEAIPGISIILGNDEKYNLYEYYSNRSDIEKLDYHSNLDQLNTFHSSHSSNERTRTFLKIQDGCDYECTYCTIPLARGKSRSSSIADTVKIAADIAKTDTKEIVLTGVNTGDFGRENGESFFDLIKELDTINGIDRIRISSIEPNLLTNEMIDFIAESKLFVPHFHIPLQSGANNILADMRRRYQRDLYRDRVEYINKIIPDCCIGVDVIVGFPTETDELFIETYEFLKDLNISYLHVFSYSERPNTSAAEFENIVSDDKKKERSSILHQLSDEKRTRYNERFIGTSRKVLFEGKYGDQMQGHTDNYIKVVVDGTIELQNNIIPVKLIEYRDGYIFGEY